MWAALSRASSTRWRELGLHERRELSEGHFGALVVAGLVLAELLLDAHGPVGPLARCEQHGQRDLLLVHDGELLLQLGLLFVQELGLDACIP